MLRAIHRAVRLLLARVIHECFSCKSPIRCCDDSSRPLQCGPAMIASSLTQGIKEEARRLGFDAVGISAVSSAGPLTETLLSRLHAWLNHGYHAAMAWMARDPARRADPTRVLPECRSIISVGMNYYSGHRPDEGPGRGRIARYAWGLDYHDVLGVKLRELEAYIQRAAAGFRGTSKRDHWRGLVLRRFWLCCLEQSDSSAVWQLWSPGSYPRERHVRTARIDADRRHVYLVAGGWRNTAEGGARTFIGSPAGPWWSSGCGDSPSAPASTSP